MHPFDDALVSILRWLILRLTNRENRRPQILSLEFGDLAIAKGLRKRRKAFKQVGEWQHAPDLTGKRPV